MVSTFILSIFGKISAILPRYGLAIASIPIVTVITSGNLALADTYSADYIFLLESDRQCRQIEPAYREVKAFETANYYVNICQKDNNYYYLGEAKTGTINTVFIPAHSLASGAMYRANNGNVSYIINILPDGATLTIERNGTQIVRESSFSDRCIEPYNALKMGIASQIYDSPSNNHLSFLNRSYLQLERIEISDDNFYEFNSLAQYKAETILNVSTCE
jgi:hypothetical protein